MKKTKKLTFKEAFTLVRRRYGYTQGELAAELGVSKDTISSWERGVRNPSLKKLKELNHFFGYDFLKLESTGRI